MIFIGAISSSYGRGGSASETDALLDATESGGVVTAVYTPLALEQNKPPYITDVVITGTPEVGQILTATITGGLNGPFTVGTHEYQWYTLAAKIDSTPTAIVGATSSQYTLTGTEETKYIICKARYVQVEGTNNKSEWLYSNITTAVAPASAVGDINHAWADFFNIESGESVSATWNTDVDPVLVNLGTGADWTTVDATKPTLSTDKLVFANAHRVTGYTGTHPPVFEAWFKLRFTGGAGNVFCMGNQSLFGNSASNEYTCNGLTPQPGDLTEHVFRFVYNGANSIFQVDGGTEIVFDENTTVGTLLILGQTNAAGSPGDFELKRFQRTADGVLLTTQEVSDKWTYHGF